MSFQHLEEIVRFHLPSIDRNLDIEIRRVEKNYLELYQRVDMRTPVQVEPYIRLLEQCRKIWARLWDKTKPLRHTYHISAAPSGSGR